MSNFVFVFFCARDETQVNLLKECLLVCIYINVGVFFCTAISGLWLIHKNIIQYVSNFVEFYSVHACMH